MIQSSFAEGPAWVAMTSPAADVMPLDAYAALGDAAVFWEKPLSGESLAGFGAADCREVSRTGQPFQIIDELAELLCPGRITWLANSGAPRPPGPWFGGFAFDQHRRSTARWSGFPAAKWILPELLIWRRGGSSFATAFCSASRGLREADAVVRNRVAAFQKKLPRRFQREDNRRGRLAATSDRSAWDRLIHAALRSIDEGSITKVVLARSIAVESDRPFDLPRILAWLRKSVPGCTVFSMRGNEGATFLGATPETLCRVDGRLLETEAIAGSAPEPGEPPLTPTDKEAREHRAVIDGIEQALQPLCERLQIDASPGVMGLPHLRHLRTEIRGRLRADVALSKIVAALHPTPAVGGAPRDRALRFIAERENLDRGWYAGPIGWIGDGAAELAVAIRSAIIRASEANLFVGAGVVAGSTAEGEWLETEAKSLTLLEAIGGGIGVR
ncbi:MAG TPA: isochorismate synthase [Myxococcaceae bacterium]|nr:isochorismate synthase [Myxococcaceae bacterium]